MIITLPKNIGLRDWADQVSYDLNPYIVVQRLDNDDAWQDWAVQFVTTTGLSGYNVPSPYAFFKWNDWADGLCKALQA